MCGTKQRTVPLSVYISTGQLFATLGESVLGDYSLCVHLYRMTQQEEFVGYTLVHLFGVQDDYTMCGSVLGD